MKNTGFSNSSCHFPMAGIFIKGENAVKKRLLLLVLTAASLLLTACGNEHKETVTRETTVVEAKSAESGTKEKSEDVKKITFTDALGRQISVSKPRRVVTLLGSFCDEWLLAGGVVVGTASDSFTSFNLGLDKAVADIGSHIEPNVEAIIALEPDFVIASKMLDSQVELLDTLEAAGITVAYFHINSFKDYLASLKIFTQITGHAEFYEQYGIKVSEEIEEAKLQIDGRKPTVLFLRADASSVKVKGSTGTVGGEILADLDTVNIADSGSLLEDLSMEAIIMADPEYIFVTTQGSDLEAALANVEELLISNPAWESLGAIQSGHYYVLDKALYNSKPNARWGEAYRQLADIIYPKE